MLRRLRTAGAEQVLQLLAEGCAPYAEKLVVVVFDSHRTRVAAGADPDARDLSFDTVEAPAIVAAVETRDRVVALATPGEISSLLAGVLGVGSGEGKAYLFPIVSRHTVVAMLVASEGASVSVVTAQIELLCEAAGMRLEAAEQIAKGDTASKDISGTQAARVSTSTWESLTPEDQKLHMQAQRMARVRAAQIRLGHSRELQNGTAASDVYAALRQPIDVARAEFRDAFLVKSPTMVDYLHLEVLRSLASDDDRLLGAGYPGPMQAGPMHAGPLQPLRSTQIRSSRGRCMYKASSAAAALMVVAVCGTMRADPPVAELGQGISAYNSREFTAAITHLKAGREVTALTDYDAYYLAYSQLLTGDVDGSMGTMKTYRTNPVESTPLAGKIALVFARLTRQTRPGDIDESA